ncbi:MAG: hypothetical protein HFG80_09770 [Eubacterium sp.]|jgi:hypothetical protein|nr:hypothetical protein [Eubacterium sp.]
MTVEQLIQSAIFQVVTAGENTAETEISKPYCCDLLSIAMSGAPAGCAWCTVMANLNTIAVATLTETGCIILTSNTKMDDVAISKAKAEGITVLSTPLASFDAALKIYQLLNG